MAFEVLERFSVSRFKNISMKSRRLGSGDEEVKIISDAFASEFSPGHGVSARVLAIARAQPSPLLGLGFHRRLRGYTPRLPFGARSGIICSPSGAPAPGQSISVMDKSVLLNASM